MFVCCEYCVLSDIGPCDGPIVRQEESYGVSRCLISVIKCNKRALLLQGVGIRGQRKNGRKKESIQYQVHVVYFYQTTRCHTPEDHSL